MTTLVKTMAHSLVPDTTALIRNLLFRYMLFAADRYMIIDLYTHCFDKLDRLNKLRWSEILTSKYVQIITPESISAWARALSMQNCFLRLNMIFCCRILLHIWKVKSSVAQIWLKCHSAKKRGRPTENDKNCVFGGKSTINNSNKHFNAIW